MQKPTPTDLTAQIRSMVAVVRYLLWSQLVLGFLWLAASVALRFLLDNLPIVVGLGIAAVNIPVLARLAAFELERTIIDTKRQLPDADMQQLQNTFLVLKALRRRWILSAGLAFIASMVAGTGSVIAHNQVPALSWIALVVLWAVAFGILVMLAQAIYASLNLITD